VTWVKLSDDFASHPVVLGLSDGAFRLYVAGLCYCARHLTDGVIPVAVVPTLGVERHRQATAELLRVGRWVADAGAYAVHDYLDYQESKAKVESRRERTKERVSKHRGNGNSTPAPGPVPGSKNLSSPAGRDAPRPSEIYERDDQRRRLRESEYAPRADSNGYRKGFAAAKAALEVDE
jgi:hypothetical protein